VHALESRLPANLEQAADPDGYEENKIERQPENDQQASGVRGMLDAGSGGLNEPLVLQKRAAGQTNNHATHP